MMVRAARGAITVDQDGREAVLDATERLLAELLQRNDLEAADVVSIVFTATDDIHSMFPATESTAPFGRKSRVCCFLTSSMVSDSMSAVSPRRSLFNGGG